MKFRFDEAEKERLNQLIRIKEQNQQVIGCYSSYLNQCSDFVTGEMMKELVDSCKVSAEYAFYVMLAALFDLDMNHNLEHRQLGERYLLPSIHMLQPEKYRKNAFYKNIKLPSVHLDNWEFRYESYKAYEGFIFRDLVVQQDFTEIPQLGFFEEDFTFPAVLESGVEWMTVTPNEIETIQPAIDDARGRVVTLGLGLGYFTYMVSRKVEVESITVVERDEKVIQLFTTYLLPQFEEKEKIKLVHMDAYEYLENVMKEEKADYLFADLWHDVSDGVEQYLAMLPYEDKYPHTRFAYWIETSLLSVVRSRLFWNLIDEWEGTMETDNQDFVPIEEEVDSVDQIMDWMSDEYLRERGRKVEN